MGRKTNTWKFKVQPVLSEDLIVKLSMQIHEQMRSMRVQGEGWVWKWLASQLMPWAAFKILPVIWGMTDFFFFFLALGGGCWFFVCLFCLFFPGAVGIYLYISLRKGQQVVSFRMYVKREAPWEYLEGVQTNVRIEAAKVALPRKQVQVVGLSTGRLYRFS